MPERILEKHPERTFRIPMDEAVRSLNLAAATGIVLYEAIRQLGIALQPATVTARANALENTLDQDGTGR